MKRHLTRHKSSRVAISTVLAAITATSLAACSNDGSSGSESDGSAASSNAASADVAADGLPIDARPSSDASDSTPCPYLANQNMADLNGQRVTGVSIDKRFNPPACQWLSYGNTPQAQTIIRTAKNEQAAIDMISAAITHPGTTDDAATITKNSDNSVSGGDVEHTNQPTGWEGYRAQAENAAVYAIRKGPVVVIVHSDQTQTVKTQKIAETVIEQLHL